MMKLLRHTTCRAVLEKDDGDGGWSAGGGFSCRWSCSIFMSKEQEAEQQMFLNWRLNGPVHAGDRSLTTL